MPSNGHIQKRADSRLKKEESWQPFYVGEPKWYELFLLPPNALKVWLYHYARENKFRESWPTIKRTAEECGMHPDTVVDQRKWLKDNGWLVKVREMVGEEGFPIPVFRVDKGRLPENLLPTGKNSVRVTGKKSVRVTGNLSVTPTGKISVAPTGKKSAAPPEKSLYKPVSVEPVPLEPVPLEPVPIMYDNDGARDGKVPGSGTFETILGEES